MREKPFYATSLKQLLVLAAPGREDIVDAIAVMGPSTVPEIARFLGRPRNAVYYHIKTLRDSGLVLESLLEREAVKPTLRYALPGRPVIVKYNLATARSRRAVMKLGRVRFRSGERGFVRACRAPGAVTEGPHRNLWAAHWNGWLTKADLVKANALLHKLVHLFRHGADAAGDRKAMQLTFGIAPVIPR
jgi:Helix-turn-helix domain